MYLLDSISYYFFMICLCLILCYFSIKFPHLWIVLLACLKVHEEQNFFSIIREFFVRESFILLDEADEQADEQAASNAALDKKQRKRKAEGSFLFRNYFNNIPFGLCSSAAIRFW
jgi:hypothetical protein